MNTMRLIHGVVGEDESGDGLYCGFEGVEAYSQNGQLPLETHPK